MQGRAGLRTCLGGVVEAPWGRAGLPGWARRSSVGGRKQSNNSKQAGGRFKWTLQLESPRPGQAEELQSPQAFRIGTGGCWRVREGVGFGLGVPPARPPPPPPPPPLAAAVPAAALNLVTSVVASPAHLGLCAVPSCALLSSASGQTQDLAPKICSSLFLFRFLQASQGHTSVPSALQQAALSKPFTA